MFMQCSCNVYAPDTGLAGPHAGAPLPPYGMPPGHTVAQGYPTAGPMHGSPMHDPSMLSFRMANPIDHRDGGYIANGGPQGGAYGRQPSAYGHQQSQHGHPQSQQYQWGGPLAGHPGGPMTHSPYGPTPEGYLTLN